MVYFIFTSFWWQSLAALDISLDLQKAFDMVDHGVLLMKLEATGLDADGLRWFQSYLSGRTQLVDVHGTCLSFVNVTCGVP